MARINLGRVVGRSAYEEAVRQGYVGTESQWLETLKGEDAYQIAVDEGYVGTKEQWLAGLKGQSAYQNATQGGFIGTEQEFNTSLASIGNINNVLDQINGEIPNGGEE